MIFRENYVKKIMAFTDTPFVKVLTGVRRCGKSTIMQMIMDELRKKGISEERIVSYRFDSMEYEDMTAKHLYEMIKTKLSDTEKTFLFLDEVQEISSWEKTVNSINTDFNVDIYVLFAKIRGDLFANYRVNVKLFNYRYLQFIAFEKDLQIPA